MKSTLTAAFIVLVTFCHSQTLATYSDKGYKVQYPTNWVLDTSKRMGTDFIFFAPKENKNDKFHENINFIIQDLAG